MLARKEQTGNLEPRSSADLGGAPLDSLLVVLAGGAPGWKSATVNPHTGGAGDAWAPGLGGV
jgi:hypothetical protein